MNLNSRFTKPKLLLLFFFSFLSLFLQEVNGYSQSPQIINFEKEDYEAARQNWSVDFNEEGIAYFANNIGLLEFDGVTWKLHESNSNSILRAVRVGKDGIIYTGAYRELGYWKKDVYGELQYFSLSPLVEDRFTTNEEFWNIIISDNKACFHSFSGLFVFESDSFRVIKPGGFVNFACQLKGDVYFTVKDVGIYKLSGEGYEAVIESSFFMGKTVRFILPVKNSENILIGTESDGIFLYSAKERSINQWVTELKDSFVQNKINQGFLTQDSNILIGTILNGLFVLDEEGQLIYHLNIENGLQSNTVLGLSSDRYRNVWLALDNGINFISFPISTSYKIKYLKEFGALYTAALHDDILYLGTNQGLYRSDWKSDKKEFSLVPNTQEQVWDCKIIDNSLFVGHNFGTFLINDYGVNKISNYSGGFSIVQNPLDHDMLVQSTYANLVVYLRKGNSWKFSHTIKSFNNLIRHLAFDHLNNLWAGHLYYGIYKIKLNDQFDSVKTMTYYGKGSELGKYGQKTYVFKVENRIVFTTGKLLYTYDDLIDSIVPYDLLNENLGNYAGSFRIIPGPEHRYWFINNTGIACFEIHNSVVSKVKEYPNTLFENKLIKNHENVIPFEKEKALVCLENGYAILNTASEEEGENIKSYELQLREIASNDKHENIHIEQINAKKISIPYVRNSLNIRYSFPFFSSEKRTFQYKIEGLTDNWSNKLDKPIFTIKRIPPGSYVLMARALNCWGKSSKIHSLKFTILPPWYQSSLAYFIYVVTFALLIFYARHLTVKRVKLKEKRKRLQKERELIQLRNEKLRSEIAFKSEQLANSTMSIIKKNEFLMSLKEKLKKQKESLGTRYPDKYFQSIVKKIDENISGQDDWNVFEANFVQAHETFLKNLKHSFPELTPSDLRLCAYLRINLTSKDIAPLLGISVRGVENHRYRLRKKLNLAADENLTEFILSV